MGAGPWEGPVNERKRAELCDVGGEEDNDELPPGQVEECVEGVLQVQLLAHPKALQARKEGLPAVQEAGPGPICPQAGKPAALCRTGWHLLLLPLLTLHLAQRCS